MKTKTLASNSKRAFTLVELLVVIAIIAGLASMLLPAIAKAAGQARGAKCLSNLRQMAIGVRLYAEDNGERFPFANAMTPGGFPRVEFVDFFTETQPYMATNSGLYLCPMDRGPFTIGMAPAAGLATNEVTPSSYVLMGGFYSRWDANGFTLKQRFLSEVSEPARKLDLMCAAVQSKDSVVNGGITNTVHAMGRRAGGNFGFVDGHSALVRWAAIRRDPNAPNFSWNNADFADLP